MIAELRRSGPLAQAERLVTGATSSSTARRDRRATGSRAGRSSRSTSPSPRRSSPERSTLAVAYEDEHLLVVDKPAGLVVHPAGGHRPGRSSTDCSRSGAEGRGRGSARDRPPARPRHLRPARRRALRGGACAAVGGAIRERRGRPPLPRARPRNAAVAHGRITAPIGRDRRDRTRHSLDTDTPRDAVTWFEVRELLGERAARGPARDRRDAPDPRPPRGDRAPGLRRPRLRRRRRPRPGAPVPPRAPARFDHPFTGEPSTLESPLRATWRGTRRARGGLAAGADRRRLATATIPVRVLRPGDASGRGCRRSEPGSVRARRRTDTPTERMHRGSRLHEGAAGGRVHFGHQTRRWNPKMSASSSTSAAASTSSTSSRRRRCCRRRTTSRGTSPSAAGGSSSSARRSRHRTRSSARPRRVGQPYVAQPLARRPAHELAHDRGPHRVPPRAPAPEGGGPARAAPGEGAHRDGRRAREARLEPRRRLDMKRQPDAVFIVDLRKERSPSARRSGSACR